MGRKGLGLTPRWAFAIVANSAMLAGSAFGGAPSETVIYTFQGGADGATPGNGVIADSAGNLYGTTEAGGGGACSTPSSTGCGTVFELTPPPAPGGTWKETVLYAFQGGTDGAFPNGLILDQAGNLFATTAGGGSSTSCSSAGCGTLFELSPPSGAGGSWTKTVLYSFQGGTDGFDPSGSLVADSAGNLYGATFYGGPKHCPDCGTIFEFVRPAPCGSWTKATLYTFQRSFGSHLGGDTLGDGQNPQGVTFDDQGNLFGTTLYGGFCQNFEGGSCWGAIFEVSPPAQPGGSWSERVLHRFDPIAQNPASGVVIDNTGALYGATFFEVYRLTEERLLEDILSFEDRSPLGGYPWAGVILGPDGILFGVAQGGTCCGVTFELQPPAQRGGAWTNTILHNFTGSANGDGELPNVNLLLGADGNLYGTTWRGGSQGCQYYGSVGCGTVFQVVP
jgi:hypothetical protein